MTVGQQQTSRGRLRPPRTFGLLNGPIPRVEDGTKIAFNSVKRPLRPSEPHGVHGLPDDHIVDVSAWFSEGVVTHLTNISLIISPESLD